MEYMYSILQHPLQMLQTLITPKKQGETHFLLQLRSIGEKTARKNCFQMLQEGSKLMEYMYSMAESPVPFRAQMDIFCADFR
jgi:hypothetical protein